MTVSEYNDLLERVTNLPPEQKVDLLAEVAAQLRDDNRKNKTQHSIMELEGLGKEIWAGIDAQEYVDQERNSWDG